MSTKKLKRSDFFTKDDYEDACALVRLARVAQRHGASLSEISKALGEQHWFSPAILDYLKEEEA